MNELIQGLEILRTYVKQSNLNSVVRCAGVNGAGGVVVTTTDRQLPYDTVRVMMNLGWVQEDGVALTVGTYDRNKPWIFPLAAA